MSKDYLTLQDQLQIQTLRCQQLNTREGQEFKNSLKSPPRKIPVLLPIPGTTSSHDDLIDLKHRATDEKTFKIVKNSDNNDKLSNDISICCKLPVLSPILKYKKMEVFSQIDQESKNKPSETIQCDSKKTLHLKLEKSRTRRARTARKTVIDHKKSAMKSSMKYGTLQSFQLLLNNPVPVPKHYECIDGDVCYPSRKFDVLVANTLKKMYNIC